MPDAIRNNVLKHTFRLLLLYNWLMLYNRGRKHNVVASHGRRSVRTKHLWYPLITHGYTDQSKKSKAPTAAYMLCRHLQLLCEGAFPFAENPIHSICLLHTNKNDMAVNSAAPTILMHHTCWNSPETHSSLKDANGLSGSPASCCCALCFVFLSPAAPPFAQHHLKCPIPGASMQTTPDPRSLLVQPIQCSCNTDLLCKPTIQTCNDDDQSILLKVSNSPTCFNFKTLITVNKHTGNTSSQT